MVELVGLSLVIVGCLGVGLAVGMFLGYLMSRRLIELNTDLSNKIYMMKRQGFVPQFEFEQRKIHDPSDDVVEF